MTIAGVDVYCKINVQRCQLIFTTMAEYFRRRLLQHHDDIKQLLKLDDVAKILLVHKCISNLEYTNLRRKQASEGCEAASSQLTELLSQKGLLLHLS